MIDHAEETNRILANDLDEDDIGEEYREHQIPGAPEGWIPPGPPIGFMGYLPKSNAPAFLSGVDNSGIWSPFCFQLKYGAKRRRKNRMEEYIGHFTPAGAKVVPADASARHEVNGWRFHYDGWKTEVFDRMTFVRGKATKDNLKSDVRRGCLDAVRLKAHGLKSERMKSDLFFFLQLVLPVCDPKHSGINNDGRMLFFNINNTCKWICNYGEGLGRRVWT
jgi:hypothetical protein